MRRIRLGLAAAGLACFLVRSGTPALATDFYVTCNYGEVWRLNESGATTRFLSGFNYATGRNQIEIRQKMEAKNEGLASEWGKGRSTSESKNGNGSGRLWSAGWEVVGGGEGF